MKKTILYFGFLILMLGLVSAATIERTINDDTNHISYQAFGTSGRTIWGGLIYESIPPGYTVQNYNGLDSKFEGGVFKMPFTQNKLPQFDLVGSGGAMMSGTYQYGDSLGTGTIGGNTDIDGGGYCVPMTCIGLGVECGTINDGCSGIISCGTCSSGYSCTGGKCVANPTCGDGTCNTGETCSTCPSDCGVCPSNCGDGVCDSGETCSNCAKDCGECPTTCTTNADCEFYQKCEDGQCTEDITKILLIVGGVVIGIILLKSLLK
jgi:hypothetical protein